MMSAKLEANKSNWTGDDFTMIVHDNDRFEIEGLDGVFTMTQKTIEGDTIYTVTGTEYDGCNEWRGYRFEGDEYALFSDYLGSIQRADESEYVAFAQLAWNLI